MPTKSQPPGPNPATTSLGSRSRSKVQESGSTVGRAGSPNGVVLDKGQEKKKSEGKLSSTPFKPTTPDSPQAKDASEASPTNPSGANRQRRRPRKLNKDPTTQRTGTVPTSATVADGNGTAPVASTTELEALKSRVRGLEAKVEGLYKSGRGEGGTGARSPRRRGKGRKGSNAIQGHSASTIEPAKVEEIEDEPDEADDELVRLEGKLGIAKRDLESYRTRPRNQRSTSGASENIEEIPRDAPGAENIVNTGDKQVTLTGSYRIPLPSSVSMEDVKSIQSGVSAAQNVAKSFLEQRRVQQTARAPNTRSGHEASPKTKRTSSSLTTTKEQEGGGAQSWSEWFGGYSVAISRAAKNIEAEAAIESRRAGAQAGREGSTSYKRNAAKSAARSKAGASASAGQ